jgi:hypothetical protein
MWCEKQITSSSYLVNETIDVLVASKDSNFFLPSLQKVNTSIYATYHCGRRASIGVTLDAFHAGRSPASILSPTEISQTLIISNGR